MKKTSLIIMAVLLILNVFTLSGCTNMKYESASSRKIIIDVDAGADDISSIILAAANENVEILGITVLCGNVDLEQGCKNVLQCLEIVGKSIPVYKGSSSYMNDLEITTYSVFGKDGMGDQDLIHPTTKPEEKDAVDFIIETVNKYPNEVDIIMLGPATNIAKAIKYDSESMKKVKGIWSMGTTGLGTGNASPVAEYNVYKDPLAYKIVMDFGVDVTIIGFNICESYDALWSEKQFEKLSSLNKKGEFIAKSFKKIREFYKNNGYDDTVTNCDGLAMICYLYPSFIKKTFVMHASVMVDENETYGQVIFYKKGFNYDIETKDDFKYNVTLITDVEKKDFFELFYNSIK